MGQKPPKRDRYKTFYFTLFADEDEAQIIRGVMNTLGTQSPQRAVMTVFREFQARRPAAGQEEAADELTYRRLYHDLALETLQVRKQARRFLRALDQAKEAVEGLKDRR